MSNVNSQDRLADLIHRLDVAYAKGLMSPEEYGVLRQGLELRLAPSKTPSRKRRHFKLTVATIAAVAMVILVTIPLVLRSTTRVELDITDVKLDQGTLSMSVKNTGTADAHSVEVNLLYPKGKIPIKVLDLLKPQDSLSVSKKLDIDQQQLYGLQFNIVVSCREGFAKSYPFKP
ncbi:MAG: hypothetical protein NTX81_05400 [Candidatus Bathyarchaeota archaeon]|nr:hypothetical protein [Candidatus Bathyarchaeota archaeon]